MSTGEGINFVRTDLRHVIHNTARLVCRASADLVGEGHRNGINHRTIP